jgi:hypothetical protein
MDLTPYVSAVRDELAAAAESGGPEVRALAERLAAPLESAIRLTLLDALSAAAAEITRDLAPGSVDLRLRGREPSFVVAFPPADHPSNATDDTGEADEPLVSSGLPAPVDGEEGAMTRINLRLGQDLKDRVEEAAREATLSVNAWLVRAATAALAGERPSVRSRGRSPRGNERYSGWVR